EPAPQMRLAVVDLQGLSLEARAAAVKRLASAEAARAFDLRRGPVLRWGLLKLAANEQVLLLTLHHIASDGWSTAVLVRELVQLYEWYRRGAASQMPDLEIQYGDYAVWQRAMLEGGALEAQMQYWREELGGEVAGLELRVD